MKRPYYIAIAAAAVLITGSATAQRFGGPQAAAGGAGGFNLLRFDANNDGKVTRAEMSAAEKARFTEADANKDGFVTPEEMRTAMRRHMMKARFASLDTDHNGQISMAEFEKGGPGASGPEADHGPGRGGPGFHGRQGHGGPDMARMRMHEDGRGPHRAGGPGAGPGAGANAASEPQTHRMGPADANADGKLSYEEFSARSLAAFDRADTDKNGTVTIAELRAASGLTK